MVTIVDVLASPADAMEDEPQRRQRAEPEDDPDLLPSAHLSPLS